MIRITDIRETRGIRRCRIFLDGDEWRTTSREAIRDLGLIVGEEHDLDRLMEQLARAERTAARARALRILDHRDHTRFELNSKLILDGYPDDIVAETVADMKRLGIVDDVRVADVLARSFVQAKGYGRKRIYFELRRRGIVEEVITNVVDIHAPSHDEESRAIEIASRLRSRGKDDAKLYSRLARLGFEHAIAKRAVHEAIEDIPTHEE